LRGHWSWRSQPTGPTQVIALPEGTAEASQSPEFAFGLDPFGDYGGIVCIESESQKSGAESPPCWITIDAADEANVELDDVGMQIEDVAEA
jgi:hypothetical protein